MDASKFNRGIQLMYHNDTKQVGLSYAAGSVILKAPFSFIAQGYFGNGPDRKLEMPAIADGEVYFLPFDAVLNQSKSPLLAVQPGTLTKCETLESNDISTLQHHQSPLPAFVNDRGYGLIYTSDKSFLEHFETAPVYLSVDYTYQPEKKHVSKDHVIFLSMRSILLSALMCDDASWDPVEVVPLKAVAAYLPALFADGSAALSKPLPLPSQAPRSLSKVSFHNHNTEHRTPAAAIVPPAVVVRGHKPASSGDSDSKTYAEGLTTGGLSTGSSSEGLGAQAPGLPYDAGSGRRMLTASRLHAAPDTTHTANSPASDSEREDQHSPMSSLASSPVASRGTKKLVVPAAAVVGAVTDLRPRVPGPSDVWRDQGDTRRVKLSKTEQAEENKRSAAARAFMQDVWPHTLEEKGWTKNWSRNLQGDHHLSFLTPGWSNPVRTFSILKDCRFIENLEVFHSYEALREHVAVNPCLEESWIKLWDRLRVLGWQRAEASKGRDVGQTLFYHLNFAHQYRTDATPQAKNKTRAELKSLEDARAKGLVPGQHLFVSRAALMKYIARFPYLLQDDLTLVDTLQRLNWRLEVDSSGAHVVQWALSAEDRANSGPWKFKANNSASFVWVSLAELRRRLWLVPERLFQHNVPSIPAVVVLQALRLTSAEGEALDEDLLSPQVKNMPREERDVACLKLETLLDKYLEKCSAARPKIDEKFEDSVRTALRRVGWVDQPCSWSKEWWSAEVAWVAPWVQGMVQAEKEPVLGRDFFWTLLAVAQYASDQARPAGAANDFFYTPLLHAPPRFVPAVASVRAAEREHANNLVLKLVRNHRGNPFEEGPLKDMLVTTGWKVFGDDDADLVVFVPHWRAKEVTQENYAQFEADVDYFDTLGGVQSHLEDYGNKPAPVAVAPVYSTATNTTTTNAATANVVNRVVPRNAAPAVPTPEEYVLHLGKRYLAHSVEGAVVAELEGERYFVKIFNLLKAIGWNTAWIGSDRSFMITPWGYARTAAFADDKLKKIKNLSLLRENIDYFVFSDEGKVAMVEYLLKRGFEERIADYDPFSEISEAVSAGEAKVKTVRTKAAKAPPKEVKEEESEEMEVEVEVEESTPSQTSQTYSSPSGSEASTLMHLGKTYEIASMQAQVVIELEGECYFGRMFPLLKVLGWGTAWIRNDTSFIITPWGYDRAEAFADAKKKKIKDLSLLRENIDYFVFSDEGKAAMYNYLTKRGFRERVNDYDPFSEEDNSPRKAGESPDSVYSSVGSGSGTDGTNGNSSGSSGSSGSGVSEGPVFTAEGVSFAGSFYDAESKEYRLVRQLFTATPHFGQIYTSLKCDFLWGSHYVAGLNASFIFAAWALEVDGAFAVDARMRYKLVDLSVLEEGVDYFRDDSEGKAAMILYLKTHGIEGPSGRVPSPPRFVPSHSPEAKTHKSMSGQDENEDEEEEVKEEVVVETHQQHNQQQQQRKRKAESSPARDTHQQEQQQHMQTHTHTHTQAHTTALTTEDGRRSRRGGALDPATEVCPIFKADYEQLRQLMKRGKFSLPSQATAPLDMWLALKAINRSWRCLDDVQGRTWYFRTVGCNEHTVGKFTEGVDYFRSLEAFWVFLKQQYALHFDSHSLISEEEKAGGAEVPRAAGPRSRASSFASSKGTLSQQSNKSNKSQSSRSTKSAKNTDKGAENGAEKIEVSPPGVDLRKFDGLTIRKRSPSKACYRAFDPSSNLDRLVAGVSSPVDSPQMGGTRDGESSDEDSYFQRRRLAAAAPSPSLERADYDVDMQEVYGDILKDSPQCDNNNNATGQGSGGDFDDDTDHIPLTQHLSGIGGGNIDHDHDEYSDHGGDNGDDDDGEESVEDMLSMAHPPFQRIVHRLGWTYAYVNANTAMPNGEPSAGLTHVYLRPSCTLQSAVVKGEDYFLTEESLIDYLRVQLGLQAMPQYVSNSKKPRSTRSGRVIDANTSNTTANTSSNAGVRPSTSSSAVPRSAHSSPVATTSQPSKSLPVPIPVPGKAVVSVHAAGEKRGRSALTAAEETEHRDVSKENKRAKSSASSPPASPSSAAANNTASGNSSCSGSSSGASTPPSVPGIIPQVSSVMKGLKSASKQSTYSAGLHRGGRSSAAPLGRETEYALLQSLVVSALSSGHGGAAYLCGSPGMGKTHLVVSLLDAIAHDRRAALPPASKEKSPEGKKVRSSDLDLGYHVVWLSGAGMKSKNDVFAPIAEQLNLKPCSALNKGNSKSGRSDAEQMVIDRFSAPGLGVELHELSPALVALSSTETDAMEVEEEEQTGAAAGFARSHSTNSSKEGRPRSRAVAMTVLVIDEMDLANKDAVAQLCQLATCAPSSLVVLGMGNVVNYVHGLNLTSTTSSSNTNNAQGQKVQQLVLEPYTKGRLSEILVSLTRGLFKDTAVSFLAQKVEQNNKGDMRALLRYADVALTKAASKLCGNAATPSFPFVEVKHIIEAYGSTKDPSVSLLESFSPLTVRLLVSMLKFETEQPGAGLSEHNILVAYSNYLEMKKLPSEDVVTARGRLNDLVNYNFVRNIKPSKKSEKSMYSILVPLEVVLQANLGEGQVREELLLIKNNRQRQEAAASLTQY